MNLNVKRTFTAAGFLLAVLLLVFTNMIAIATALAFTLGAFVVAETMYGQRFAAIGGGITPTFLFDFEKNMQAIQENEYLRLAQDMWWPQIVKRRPSGSKAERINWLLSTAMIRSQGKGGNMQFEDLVQMTKEYVNRNAGAGFEVTRDQLEDLDGGGLDLAGQWSRDIGAYMAYWPQKQVIKAILNGEATGATAYDSVSYFSGWNSGTHTGNHPFNPYDTTLGGYANILTGSPDTGSTYSYPGACPIDDSVTVDIALANLGKAIAYVRSIKMPNGEDPRKLKVVGIYNPPRMTPRVQQLTNAKFLAQAASGGAGSGDVDFLIRNWGLAKPTEVDEFSANFSYGLDLEDGGGTVQGNDTTYYLACEQIGSSQLGALTYVDREPFKVNMFGDSAFPELSRRRVLQYQCLGRNVTGYGHPFLIIKCKGS